MRCRELTFGACIALLLGCLHAKESVPQPVRTPVESKVFASGVIVEPPLRIHSKGFTWEHEIQVAVPATYNTEQKAYPVLWLTDGLVNFAIAVQALNGSPWAKYLPEMIIVGVGGPSDAIAEFQARRAYEFTLNNELAFDGIGGELAKRSLERAGGNSAQAGFGTGGAGKFLEFLVDELRTTLEKRYRMSGSHTLFGSSGGGFFCTYALLSRTAAFDKYICLSPNLNSNNYELFRLEQKYAETNKDLPAAVYFAAGENEILQGGIISGLGIVSSMARMAEILKLRAYPSLRLYVRIFPDEEHGSFKQAGLIRGLRELWASNEPPQ